MLLVRFDLRAPDVDASSRAAMYEAAVEMCAFVDGAGIPATVVLSEHHGSPDGYLPSPVTLAAAIAARTRHITITVAALVAPLHQPRHLAEAMVVVDHLSRGRTSYVLGVGYRPEEYEMFGLDFATRGRRMEEVILALREAFDGDVTPPPFTPGGPLLLHGGGSPAAARRAGRLGMPFYGERSDSGLREVYEQAAYEAGHSPVFFAEPPSGAPMVVVVVPDGDVEAGWIRYGPHLLHDARSYQAWFDAAGVASTAHGSRASTVEEMRAEVGRYSVVAPDVAIDLHRRHGLLATMPLCGGTPPELAWPSLRAAVDAVAASLSRGR